MKLAVKQPLIMISSFLIIGAISGLTLINLQIRSNQIHQQNAVDDMAGILSNQVKSDMLHSSPQILQNFVSELRGVRGITEIVVYDTKGKVFASTEAQEEKTYPTQPDVLEVIKSGNVSRHTASLSGGREYGAIYPLFSRTECHQCHGAETAILGALEIGVNAEPFFADFREQLNALLLTGGIALAVLAAIFFLLSRHLVLNRLKLLARAAKQIAIGDYSHRVDDVNRDEIGVLAHAFNDMAEKVQTSINQLKETVDIRTEERGTLDSIMSSMGEGLMVVDNQRNLAYLNPAAEKLLGLNAADFLGQPIKTFSRAMSTRIVGPKDWENMLTSIFNQPEGQATVNLTLQLPELHEIEASFFTVGRPGQRSGIGAIIRDVTKEREVDRMKTEFISVASHDLRTPLTVIYGFAELLLTSKNSLEEQRQWLERIYKESQRLTNIVDDLLNISHIESGRLSLKLEAVSVQSVITQLIKQFNSNQQSHIFSMNVPDKFPKLLVDVERLTQVLYNLLDNAAKYSPDGGPVTVSARVDKENNQAIIAVADKGLGIPPGEIPKLFIRFHRIHRPETIAIRGTGLGLSIVKSIVEMMGGRVWVESQVNVGSIFYVALPLAVPEA